jgi:Zn-dependent protease
MYRDGHYLHVGRIGGVAFRAHWTLPIGLLALGGFQFNPVVWVSLLAITVIHESGHAVMANAFGLAPRSIDVHGVGGRCIYEGYVISDVARSAIAWGGVLAQVILFVLARRIGELAGDSGGPHFLLAIGMLTGWNAFIAALNLLPIPGLDGAEAWRLFRWANIARLGHRVRARARRIRARLSVLPSEPPDAAARTARQRGRIRRASRIDPD